MSNATAQNLWQDTATAPIFATSHGNVTVDIAIIGGGFSGCSAALEAASQGASTILLEAQTIGFGGSGRNVGLVNAGLWTPPQEVEDTLGANAGKKLNTALAAAPQLVFDLISQHEIACDTVRNGTLHCAQSKAHARDLHTRFDQLSSRGAPVQMLDEAETQKRVGSSKFVSSLFDPRAGTIHPLKFAQGLALAARKAGATIVEHCPSTTSQTSSGWQVTTPHGTINARHLIIATNAYDQAQQRSKQKQFSTVHFFQLATAPLSADQAATILPHREGTWDCATVMTSLRLDASNRLLLGAVGSLDHATAPFHKNWGRKKLTDLFPQLASIEFTHQWCGKIAMTADHLPKIQKIGAGAYAPFGFSGRGIGPGTLFGKTIAQAVLSGDEQILPITPIESHSERFTKSLSAYYELGATAVHFGFPLLKHFKIG